MTRLRASWAWVSVCVILALFLRASPADTQAHNPFRGRKLYVDPTSPAARQAVEWQRSRPEDAARMRALAAQPQVIWLGDWMRDIRRESDVLVSRIVGAG